VAITIQSEMKDDILWIVANGRDESLEDVENYGMAVIQAGVQAEASLILLDERKLKYDLSTYETFESANFATRQIPVLNVKVALLCHSDQVEAGNFWVTVAANRGLDAETFTDEDRALAWLRGD